MYKQLMWKILKQVQELLYFPRSSSRSVSKPTSPRKVSVRGISRFVTFVYGVTPPLYPALLLARRAGMTSGGRCGLIDVRALLLNIAHAVIKQRPFNKSRLHEYLYCERVS